MATNGVLAEFEAAGIRCHAEAFDDAASARRRLEAINACMRTAGLTMSAYRLPPQPGVVGYVVAVVGTSPLDSVLGDGPDAPRGRVTTLPTEIWLQMIARAHDMEHAFPGKRHLTRWREEGRSSRKSG